MCDFYCIFYKFTVNVRKIHEFATLRVTKKSPSYLEGGQGYSLFCFPSATSYYLFQSTL